ncbi:hypothetical protein NVS89_00150 [Ancylobacter sp. MQZ15Z-1]|uniref:Uncharacterized protein n=1 Tax=Ancylobacter mangrovi TaxID=2972472 RepID=A0A9X2PDE7_9HYPH|nr:hypothetical protein [Ancylobacter mangrovi]MCS0493487.1 hypothetical protein [Ancylobacter mangrovi]
MWAINEWETGKWNVPVTTQTMALAAQAVAIPVAQAAVPAGAVATVPAAAPQAAPPQPATDEAAVAAHGPEPRQRVDSGVATAETLEKWDIDENEPSWDPSALAETWAKLRRELSSAGPKRATAVAADLPRTAQLAKGPVGGVPKSGPAPKSGSVPKSGSAGITRHHNTPPAKPMTAKAAAAKPVTAMASAMPTLSSRLAANSYAPAPVKASYVPGGSFSGYGSTPTPPAGTLRKAAGAGEPTSAPAFLRPGTSRPR